MFIFFFFDFEVIGFLFEKVLGGTIIYFLIYCISIVSVLYAYMIYNVFWKPWLILF